MKTGVIDVGGGFRSSFGTGILDYCLDHSITFDYCIGVSAGSANLCSYMAEQKGRNLYFYTKYFDRWQYMSIKNLVETGSYIGLDYIYSDLSNHDGEYPLDWKKIRDGHRDLVIVATNALTGEPHYFHKWDMRQDEYDPIKASCCVPVVNRPYVIDGTPYFDGGLSDPVPYKKAFEDGCDKVVLILTRPAAFKRAPKKDKVITDLLKPLHPHAAKAMANRAEVYNRCVEECLQLQEEGKMIVLAPDDIGDMKTLTKDVEEIKALYQKGYDAGSLIPEEWFKNK